MTKKLPKSSPPYYSPWKTGFTGAAKSIGNGIAKGISDDFGKGVATGVAKSFGSFFGGFKSGEYLENNKQEEKFNFGFQNKEAQNKEKVFKPTYFERQRREALLFSNAEYRKEQEIKEQIEAIRAELLQIIEEMKKLGENVREAEKTVKTEMVNPGKYHVSILERIRQILRLFRQQISESSSWLEMSFAKKRAKRFWHLAKKKGTQFSLSNEHTLARAAG